MVRAIQFYHLSFDIDQDRQIKPTESTHGLIESLSNRRAVAIWQTCLRKIVFLDSDLKIDQLMNERGYVFKARLKFLVNL